MAQYVPDVGTTLEYGLLDATETTDVAAVPGGVYAVNYPALNDFDVLKTGLAWLQWRGIIRNRLGCR